MPSSISAIAREIARGVGRKRKHMPSTLGGAVLSDDSDDSDYKDDDVEEQPPVKKAPSNRTRGAAKLKVTFGAVTTVEHVEQEE